MAGRTSTAFLLAVVDHRHKATRYAVLTCAQSRPCNNWRNWMEAARTTVHLPQRAKDYRKEAEVQLRSPAAFRALLHGYAVVEVAEAETAILLRYRDAVQAHIAHRAPEVDVAWEGIRLRNRPTSPRDYGAD